MTADVLQDVAVDIYDRLGQTFNGPLDKEYKFEDGTWFAVKWNYDEPENPDINETWYATYVSEDTNFSILKADYYMDKVVVNLRKTVFQQSIERLILKYYGPFVGYDNGAIVVFDTIQTPYDMEVLL